MKTQRIYLIGAGAISREHAKALAQIPGSFELHVADPVEAALQSFAADFPTAERHHSAEAMLAEPARDDDVVVVCVPPFLHEVMTMLALGSGRHVLCEKPLGMDEAQADRMFAAAQARNRRLGCCSVRFAETSASTRVRRHIEDGDLGRLVRVVWQHRSWGGRPGIEYQPQARWFLDRSKAGCGPLLDWGPYDFAMLNQLLQPVAIEVRHAWTAHVESSTPLPPGTVYDIENQAGATLLIHRADGSVLPLLYERSNHGHSDTCTHAFIEGTRASVTWDWLMLGDRSVRLTTEKEGKSETTVEVMPPEAVHFHAKPLAGFVRRLRGEAVVCVMDDVAAFCFATLQAIYTAARTGRAITVTK